ncbi:MAG: hypothetical protein HYS06_11885 [Methylocystis sp.]|nr:hypothetical protein [Methylocystis sp.]
MRSKPFGRTLLLCVLFCSNYCYAQSFDITKAQFVEKYNVALRVDGGEQIKKCRKVKDSIACEFTDVSFQKSVSGFKALNLANGRFDMATKLLLSEKNGKVSQIILSGDRKDPMNLFHFVGHLGSMMHALGQEANKNNDLSKELLELGLTRGDDDPTIGNPKTLIEAYAAIRCNNQVSSVTTTIGCVLEPRY